MPLQLPAKLSKASSQEAASLRKSTTRTFPFLEYAVRNVLYHADSRRWRRLEGGLS